MTATEERHEVLTTDPARLAAVAVLSAAGADLSGLDIDAATAAMRRELGVAEAQGRANEVAYREKVSQWLRGTTP